MSEEHKEFLESLPKPRQIMTDPAKSCQIQPVTDFSVASADQEPALSQSQQPGPGCFAHLPHYQGRRPASRRQRALDPPLDARASWLMNKESIDAPIRGDIGGQRWQRVAKPGRQPTPSNLPSGTWTLQLEPWMIQRAAPC